MGSNWSYRYDNSGNIVLTVDPIGRRTEFGYDLLDRLLWSEQDGKRTEFDYDNNGNLVEVTDANGNSTVYKYNVLNLVTNVIDAENRTNRYYYDAYGRQTKMKDARGHENSFVYDATYGRLWKRISAENKVTEFQYDLAGRLVKRINPDGTWVSYAYNDLDVMTNKMTPSGRRDVFRTDLLGQITEYATYSNLTMLADAGEMSYDKLGRLVEWQNTVMNKGVNYVFDAEGQRLSMTDPQSRVTKYGYDLLGNVMGITNNGIVVAQYAFDGLGRQVEQVLGNGARVSTGFDNMGNLAFISNMDNAGSLVQRFAYGYDSVGNRIAMTNAPGVVTEYQFDRTYQLTNVIYPNASVEKFIYDQKGNRTNTTKNGTNRRYAYSEDDRLRAAGYGFDYNGNMTTNLNLGRTNFLSYDEENRLIKCSNSASVSYYKYDAFGRRISKTVNGIQEKYVFDGLDVLSDYDASGNMKATYTFHPQSIDEPIMMTRANGSNYYFMKDGQGSVTAILDENGTVRNMYKYDAFGTCVSNYLTVSNRYFYTSREYDEESGLYFYRARMYDSKIGRFTSEDPILDGNNWYAYVGNNPINFTDPLGEVKTYYCVGGNAPYYVPDNISGQSRKDDRLSSQDLMPYPRRHDDNTPDRIFSGGFQQNTQSLIENSIANSMGGIGDSISQSIAASMSASAGESVGQSQQPTYGQYGPSGTAPVPRGDGGQGGTPPGISIYYVNNKDDYNLPGNMDIGTYYDLLEDFKSPFEKISDNITGFVEEVYWSDIVQLILEVPAVGTGVKATRGVVEIAENVPKITGETKKLAQGASMLGEVIKQAFKKASGAKGALNTAKTTFKSSHYASRLEAAGVNVKNAESIVSKEVEKIRSTMKFGDKDVRNRIKIDGVEVEYRAHMLEDGTINIGTIHVVKK